MALAHTGSAQTLFPSWSLLPCGDMSFPGCCDKGPPAWCHESVFWSLSLIVSPVSPSHFCPSQFIHPPDLCMKLIAQPDSTMSPQGPPVAKVTVRLGLKVKT